MLAQLHQSRKSDPCAVKLEFVIVVLEVFFLNAFAWMLSFLVQGLCILVRTKMML